MIYTWNGWHSGADDCDPPEPGKEWLSIEEDGEEFAIIVLRTDAPMSLGGGEALLKARNLRERRAQVIVDALNRWGDDASD